MKVIKIGFTGTQKGMTSKQKTSVNNFLLEQLKKNKISEVHHGDCIGADNDFHNISNKRKIPVFIHPSSNPMKRAFCITSKSNISVEKDYLERNKDIVNNSDFIIATPSSEAEELRSGTWSTVRYANNNKKKVFLIFPNGKRTTYKEYIKENEKRNDY